MPEVVVIGGPNGAGKSTFARFGLPEAMPFLNADEIAKTLAADPGVHPERESARILLDRMDRLSNERRSFAIETTLASRTLAGRLRDLQDHGWIVRLVFFCLPSSELSIARVASRVRRGGHDIPADVIRRRFASGLRNFTDLYAPLVDGWHRLNNDGIDGPSLVDCGRRSNGIVTASGVFDNSDEVVRRARLGVREALIDHRIAGSPIAIWEDDAVIHVSPEDILARTSRESA